MIESSSRYNRSQFWSLKVGSTPKSPEKRLAAAVMLRAVEDLGVDDIFFFEGGKGRADVRASAMKWIMDDAFEVFSFVYCCQALGLDVGKTREGAMRLAVGKRPASRPRGS